MTFWAAGAILGGAAINYFGSQNAANAQVGALDRSGDVQRDIFNKQTELQAPFRNAGIAAQNKLMELLGLGTSVNSPDFGKYNKDFGMSDFTTDPGYAFRLKEGLKTLDRTAAARGGVLSGSSIKAAQRYSQDYASNEYNNAFNRYQINRSNALNALQALTGAGQTATNLLSGSAQNYGNQLSDIYQNAGNARASGYIGGSNSLNNALGSALNYYQNQQLLSKI